MNLNNSFMRRNEIKLGQANLEKPSIEEDARLNRIDIVGISRLGLLAPVG
jgi:hypothetical protein